MEPIIKNLPILLIDGNYFCHRAVHGLNKGGDFHLDTTMQMMQFEEALYTQLIGLYKSFNNDYHTLIGNIIFTFDAHSWRKDITPHKPYYITDDTKIGYKENRVEDEDGINWDNWRICSQNFADRISTLLPVFNTHGAEGDDSLLMLTRFFTKRSILTIIFCTDGDLNQLIDDKYVVVYRNTKSKDLPEGEIVISNYLADLYFGDVTPMQKLMGTGGMVNSDRSYFYNLFKLSINGGGIVSNVTRVLGNGVSVPNYKTDAFIKCICGDKKDNIFPIFRWKSGGAAARNMKVTEKMLLKALSTLDVQLNDDSLSLMLGDTQDGKDLFTNLLLILRENTNQIGIAKDIIVHYNHNYRLNILKIENIPTTVIDKFNIRLKDNLPLINRMLTIETLYVNNQSLASDSADIIKTSIGHTLTDNQTEIVAEQTQYSQTMNDIDDILNS